MSARLLVLLWSGATVCCAQLPEALTRGGIDGVPPPDGPTLAGILRSLSLETNASWTGTFRIRRRGTGTLSLPVTSQVEVRESGWRVSYSTPGNETIRAERLVVVHSTNAPNQYLRAVAGNPGGDPGEPRPLATDEADTPFAGSDFLLTDLGLEFLHWPQQTRLRGELRRDRACHVLESRRPAATGDGYVRVVSWVDRESGGIIQAEAYNAAGRRVKDFEVGSVRKINGTWQLQDMEMINRLTGSRSKIEFNLAGEE